MGIAYTPARSASIEYEAESGMIPCSAVATSARQNEWTVSIGDVHRFILSGNRSKAEELVQAYGELYDYAFPAPVKPRELQTLDCEEARDGTVWGFNFRGERTGYLLFTGDVWLFHFNSERLRSWGTPISADHSFLNTGPFTEVSE